MPKRINNIFKDSLTFKKMYNAYYRAAKGKHQTKEVILFEMDLATNLTNILRDISKQNYKSGIYRKFKIYEPKERLILALPFRDRVVHQWYVEEFIKPIFLPKMIEDSYACLPEKGVHKAVKKLQYYMIKAKKENEEFYILKCDISKFFYNIDKQILYDIIIRYVKDKDFINITNKIIFDGTYKIGIPIGNYTSQYFANIYLNELDHFIKEELRIKYYIRYMDDFVLIVQNKEKAKYIKEQIKEYLKNTLKLDLNNKTNYFKNKQGVSFCGYIIFTNKIVLKNYNKKKIYKRVRKWNIEYEKGKLDMVNAANSLKSWMGHASHTNSYGYTNKILNKCKWIY